MPAVFLQAIAGERGGGRQWRTYGKGRQGRHSSRQNRQKVARERIGRQLTKIGMKSCHHCLHRTPLAYEAKLHTRLMAGGAEPGYEAAVVRNACNESMEEHSKND